MSPHTATAVLLYLMSTKLWLYTSGQECLRPANTNDQLPFRDNNFRGLARSSRSQAIITSYQFHCCGTITAWQTFVQPGGRNHNNGQYSINFQVWRPSPTVGSDGAGEYSLVGENRFTSISFPSGGQVSETPEPTNIISVKPGDVVGIYQIGEDADDGIQIEPEYRNSYLLWYQENFQEGALNIVTAGMDETLRSSTNAGFMLSVDVASSSCPTLMPTPPPTAPPTTPATTLTTAPPTVSPTLPPIDPPKDPPTDPSPPTAFPTTPPKAPPTTPALDTVQPTFPFPLMESLSTTSIHIVPNETMDEKLLDESGPTSLNSTDERKLIITVSVIAVAIVLLHIFTTSVAVILHMKRRLHNKVKTKETMSERANVYALNPFEANQPMEIEENECYGIAETNTTIPMNENDCYGTVAPDISSETGSTNYSLEQNECYGVATDTTENTADTDGPKSNDLSYEYVEQDVIANRRV